MGRWRVWFEREDGYGGHDEAFLEPGFRLCKARLKSCICPYCAARAFTEIRTSFTARPRKETTLP